MTEEKATKISGREIQEELDKGPGHFKDVVAGFCKDVETLVKSAQNLYEEEHVLLALAGVKLKVTITSDINEQPLVDCEIGARIG